MMPYCVVLQSFYSIAEYDNTLILFIMHTASSIWSNLTVFTVESGPLLIAISSQIDLKHQTRQYIIMYYDENGGHVYQCSRWRYGIRIYRPDMSEFTVDIICKVNKIKMILLNPAIRSRQKRDFLQKQITIFTGTF